MKAYLKSITLRGFRAYLQEQTFVLGPKNSLAVYAPNAKGKSSLVDAIEFFFSANGTLRRLGERKSGTQAGPEALEHVSCEQAKIVPAVTLQFRRGNEELGDTRAVTRPPSSVPASARTTLETCRHDFIVRGHDLRRFVEHQTPEDRYTEVSTWFGLSPLLTVQKNLRALRRQIKEAADRNQKITLRQEDLRKATKGAVSEWTDATVIAWINEYVLKPLDKNLSVVSLSKDDAGYKTLVDRKEKEADSLGLTALTQLKEAAQALFSTSAEDKTGAIVEFEAACGALKEAADAEAAERAKAEQSTFNDVWTAAQKVFSDETLVIDSCPVCDTAISNTAKGSRAAIALHVKANLDVLATYNSALAKRRAAERALQDAHSTLKTASATLLNLLKAGKFEAEGLVIQTYVTAVGEWKVGDLAPSSENASTTAQTVSAGASLNAKEIQDRQGQHTYAGAVSTLDGLLTTRDNLATAKKEKEELGKLHDRLEASALQVDKDIAAHIASLLDGLKHEINTIYKKVQGPGATPPAIRIEAPDPEERGQLRLNLVVDFAKNRQGVVPSGYLSDSQVHTLALSVRLSAIKLFNTGFPVAILDDVVTSYDADHRKAIAALLAEEFPDFQFLVVTHDERFFLYLKEHLPASSWKFQQITHVEETYGPRYTHHRVVDAIIEDKLKNGEKAANEIRQAEEEWLLAKAREFGVEVRIRDLDKPYAYDRGELAMSLASFLKSTKIPTPKISGIANPFWNSLQTGNVENFGSHFQDNPGAAWSSGDETKRWAEFKQFRDLFKCAAPGCENTKFKRPKAGVERPLCTKCETPFAFSVPNGPTMQHQGHQAS